MSAKTKLVEVMAETGETKAVPYVWSTHGRIAAVGPCRLLQLYAHAAVDVWRNPDTRGTTHQQKANLDEGTAGARVEVGPYTSTFSIHGHALWLDSSTQHNIPRCHRGNYHFYYLVSFLSCVYCIYIPFIETLLWKSLYLCNSRFARQL